MESGWDKVLTWAEARARIEARRRERPGTRIVFTNGCFDLLHVGHVRYLAEARGLGDFLVVGLNSDDSVRRIKEPGRPVNPQDRRAEVLAALMFVDAVVIFDQEDPLELIRFLAPDVLVKGGDWPVEKIVGREVVEARGGVVRSIPLIQDASTTDTIRRILSLYGHIGRE
ncbi:MAG: D-glycero-beta-D-manno-heptose 1-phosphate adenylyltransferase [Thermodesulfobacteriota bacterium]